MNAQQKKYLVERVSKILNEKFKEVEEKYPRKLYTFEEKYNLIKEGKAKLKGYTAYSRSLYEAYEYPPIKGVKEAEALVLSKKNTLKTEAQKITDMAYFSDSEGVLAALLAFENLSI